MLAEKDLVAGESRGERPKLDRSEIPEAALRLLEENALSALSSPKSRGAVPAEMLAGRAGRARATIARAIEKQLGPRATPFDLAVHHVSTLETSGGNWSIDSMLNSAERRIRAGEDLGQMIRGIFIERFERTRGQAAPGFLASFIVQCAACANVARTREQGNPPSSEALQLVELRTNFYDGMTDLFEGVMASGLRQIGRRPRDPYTFRQIITALNSSYDGMLLRAVLEPSAITAETASDVLWQIAIGMTEPGLLSPPGLSNPLEKVIIETMIASIEAGGKVAWDSAISSEAPLQQVQEIFPSLDHLIDRCMDYLVGTPEELERLVQTYSASSARALASHLLQSLSQHRGSHPLLVAAVRPHGAFVGEVTEIVTSLLQLHEGSIGNRSRHDELGSTTAYQLVNESLTGTSDTEWIFRLNEFFAT
jgi:hypothetical protein